MQAIAANGSTGSALYDNGAPGLITGFDMTKWIEADDFTLSAAAKVTSIKFWNVQSGSNFQSTIVWQIYSNSANNSPGTLLYSGVSANLIHTSTGGIISGYVEYLNTFDITPVGLPAGTYWLALHNGPLTNMADQLVFWEGTTHIGPNASESSAAPFNGSWITNVFAPAVVAFGLPKGVPQISFYTTSDQNYSVVYKNNVNDSLWTTVLGAGSIIGTGSLMQISDSDPNIKNVPQRFYRILTAADLAFQISGALGPAITAVDFSTRSPRVSFTSVSGQSYQVQYSNSLGAAWTVVTNAVMVPGTDHIVQVIDPDTAAKSPPYRYYRVVLL